MSYERNPHGKTMVTKQLLLDVLDGGRDGLLSKPAALLACACVFEEPPMDNFPAERPGTAWARTVIDYADAERLFDKMVCDGQLVGRLAHGWSRLGVRVVLQHQVTYYATARRDREILGLHRGVISAERRGAAEHAAMKVLADRYPQEFQQLTQSFYDELP